MVDDQWKKNGFSVIMGDLPGQGLSTRRRGHIDNFDEYIEEVEKWIEAYLLKPPVFIFGHSMGGLAVIRTLQEKKSIVGRGSYFVFSMLEAASPSYKRIGCSLKRAEFYFAENKI